MIQIRQIEQLTYLYDRIKDLDAEIIQIETLAMQFVNHTCEVTLTVVDLTVRAEQQSLPAPDPEPPSLIMTPFGPGYFRNAIPDNSIAQHSFNLSTNGSMLLLKSMLTSKQREREYMLEELEKLGVAI